MRLGFSLVELVVIVLIMAVLSAVTIPSLFERIQHARLTATVRQMQQIETAVREYRAVYGVWPPNTGHGVIPPEIATRLSGIDFSNSPLGGAFDWNGPGTSVGHIGISVRLTRSAFSSEDLRRIDSELDDGSLATGYVRLLRGIYFQLCLEES